MRFDKRRVLVGLLSLALGVGTLTGISSSAQADPAPAAPNHLVVAAVWGANSDTAQWTNDWVELYNPTDQDISLGTISGSTVTSNYYQCYRSLTATPQKCSTTVGLYGTVEAHHYFLIWDANAHSPADHGTFPPGITPDLDASVKTASNGNQQGSNMGGCNTGGQILLLSSTTAGGPTFKGDLSSATAKADGVVDGVGWDNANVTPPDSAETNGATPITGVPAGTNNACVIARTFTDGVPVDTDTNRTDFSPVSPATFTLHSQISDQVAVAPVSDTMISAGAAMTPIQVQGSKGTGALSYTAAGLPDGVTIDPSTGIISGTPSRDALQGYPVTVTVTDSTPTEPETASTSFTLTLSNQLVVGSISNASVNKDAAITPIQAQAQGGTPGYTYAATGLPSGLSIDKSTGAISGTPTDALGTYSVHVTASDSASGAVSTDFTLTELASLTAVTSSDPLAGLKINEVEATGTPASDWVEVYNSGAAITNASVDLSDSSGAVYHLSGLTVASHGFAVVEGSDLDAAGLNLAASDTLYLSEAGDDVLLDQSTWTSFQTTSWARFPDGTGDFAVSAQATKDAANAAPAALSQNDLVVAGVYGADGTAFNSDWVELYNPTDHDISLGTINATTGAVTPNYYQCYRANAGTTCSSMKLYGTVSPHHYFLIWNGHNSDATIDAHSKGVPPAGIVPDLDFRYGSDDTNTAATKAANDPSGQTNNGFGGCNTGGQLWLLNAASNGVAPVGNLATPAAKATVVDGVGWTANGVTEPSGFETTGLSSGTNNACVISRNFQFGLPVDTNNNSTDFSLADPSTFALHSQTSDRIAITPVPDTEISLNEAMPVIDVQAQAIYGALNYTATGLPTGITINQATGVISGTPDPADTLTGYPVTVTVSDGVPSDTTSISFTLTVSKELRIDPVADLSLSKGTAITAIHLQAHGGTPPYTYAATGLPAGVTLDTSSGVISGTPTDSVGRYAVHVTATDSGVGDAQASVSLDFTIIELPAAGGPAPGDPLAGLKLNEVRATGTPANDFVELYNTGGAVTGASVSLVDGAGHSYAVPAQDIAANGYVVIEGSVLHTAGFDLTASDTLYLTESDGTLLDQTTWTAFQTTSWARITDGTGTFAVSAFPTKGAANSGAPVIHPNDLLVSEVNYDNNSTDWYEYSEITNTTNHAIDFNAYGLTITKSGAVMTTHDPSDTTQTSPTVDVVIPAHSTQLFWWVENQYFGVKTTAQFLANYGLPAKTNVVLVYGFTSMANSGGDHTFYISVNQGATPITQSWVDTPCAANTLNGASVCTATNANYAEHYELPSDLTNPVSAVWYNSLHSGGDDINFSLKAPLSTPGTVDLEQVGFTRAVTITSTSSTALTLHNTSSAAVDLSGYVLTRNSAGGTYTLPAGTTVAAGADLVVNSTDSGLSFSGDDYATLLAPQGYDYADGIGLAFTTGPFLHTLSYDASSGQPPVIDPTTGLPLPPAGGLYRPAGVSAQNGTVYASNTGDNVLAALANNANTIVAGSLEGQGEVGDGSPAVDAYLYQPGGTAEDSSGDVFIADSGDNVIREITTDGTIHLFAGTGVSGGAAGAVSPTSTPTTVNLWHPESVAVDRADNVFIADTFDNRVLEVTAAGGISVVAGTGKASYTGDGAAATSATLSQPAGVAVDALDDVYIADSSNNVVRRVDAATGVITTVAGNYAADQATNDCLGGFTGDGGVATSAELNDPQSVALDGAGDLFIADTFNNAVREVTPDGAITTLVNASGVAGAENTSPTGSGAVPASTALNTPYAVAIDRTSNVVYIADTRNNALAAVGNAGHSGNASGPVESAAALAISSSTTATTACAVLANGPVVSVTAPSISGIPAVGVTLTAVTGTWVPTPDSFTYQWLLDGVAIDNATQATYVVTSGDAGHLLSVSVTAIKADFAPATATSATVLVPGPHSTLTTAKPTMSGTFRVGGQITAVPGAWTAGSTALPASDFTYQWLRNGGNISGATSPTYTLVAADEDAQISVTVTGTYPGYATATKTSGPRTITAGVITAAVPTISGTAKVGDVVTAVPGAWTAGSTALSASDFTYQWLRNGATISGATGSTYTVIAADKGTRLSVVVTGQVAGYATASKTSKVTAAVAAGTLVTMVPTIFGNTTVGSTLAAQPGVWQAGAVTLAPSNFTYQWYANGKKIAGATGVTFTIPSNCLGKNITVVVTGSFTGYTSASSTSLASPAVTK